MGNKTEIAVFGGGCFWCTEAVFQRVRGVISAVSGYAGGTTKNPNYSQVSNGTTGHAEVTKIEYDPNEVAYRDLLEIFFAIHNPTTPNRQGNDIGPQYRSMILYTDHNQKQEAEKIIQELNDNKIYPDPVVTEIKPLADFYSAEDYHQNYYNQNPGQGYCQAVINPKLAKFKQKFTSLLKQDSII